ncbi:hypothetical protein [Rhodococcus sp. W8901]|uniref:hypothetical protein n=1 Tax=Rhodococcus sp. W8901 TaxID=2742603 RepID=UPI001583930D|nr:hypothetical protein [Rhodococcus sp. W8901]QKT12169.1 hypothetical protein HUN07_16940 [Rhodococcus sp. W8901]
MVAAVTNENARPVLEHRTGSESNLYQEEGSMTDFTRYVVSCHLDTGHVDQLGTFQTHVAAMDAAITHASTCADDLGTCRTFDFAAMSATLGTGDVLEYRIVADSALRWSVCAETTAHGVRINCGPVHLSLSVTDSVDLVDAVVAVLADLERSAGESVVSPVLSGAIEDLPGAAAGSADSEFRGL